MGQRRGARGGGWDRRGLHARVDWIDNAGITSVVE